VVHLLQHPVTEQSFSVLKRETLEILTLQITQAEQLCEYRYSFIREQSREQNCSTLNPPVSVLELTAEIHSIQTGTQAAECP